MVNKLRVTLMEIVTTGKLIPSRYDVIDLSEPILGRIIGSVINTETDTTFFDIEEGNIKDHVFVKAGEIKKGQDALKEIFARRAEEYVKICDTYISADTIKLLSNVGDYKDILILTQTKKKSKKITDIDAVKKEADKLPNRIIIKEGTKLHDRFILTKGEGWIVGHAMKDFGTKISNLIKVASSVDLEDAFDENWIQSKTIYDKK